MLALHGTKRKFNKFKTKFANDKSFGFGFYFYPYEEEFLADAQRWAGKSGYILTVDLDIENPLHAYDGEGADLWDLTWDRRKEFVRDKETGRVFTDVAGEWLDSDDENLPYPERVEDIPGYMKFVQNFLEENGYDSIYNSGRNEFVVYDESIVKIIARMSMKTREWEKI
jgi:hypothetical protein